MKITYLITFVTFIFLLNTHNLFAQVVCVKKEKTWFLVNENGIHLGDTQYGYNDEEFCKQFIPKKPESKVLCSWNGSSYQFYDIESGMAIGSQNQLLNYKRDERPLCIKQAALQPSSGDLICAWSGKNFSPFNRKAGVFLSAFENGYRELSRCMSNSLETANKFSICSWNSGSTLYSLNGKQISTKLGSLDECKGYQEFIGKDIDRNNEMLLNLLENYDYKNDNKISPNPFFSSDPNEDIGFSMKHCETRKHWFHLTKSENGFIVPECRPDTLYSWGGFEKLKWFIENLPNGQPWPNKLPRTLYTTHSPAATFGYGRVPIRFKIRKGTKMKSLISPPESQCDKLIKRSIIKESEIEDTIFVRTELRNSGLSFQEYLICSPKVIQSWSYLTEDHFDEILKDYRWMTSKNYKEWEAYSKQNGEDKFVGNNVDNESYNTDFTMETFNIRMNFIKLLTESKLGMIRFSNDTEPSDEQHFKTEIPIYFNPE